MSRMVPFQKFKLMKKLVRRRLKTLSRVESL